MRGSYLHLQKNYYNKRQQSRNKTYNVQDGVDKDKLEYETEAEDVHEEVTEKSEAFLTPHLGSLGLMENNAYFTENFTLVTFEFFNTDIDDNNNKYFLITGFVRPVCGKKRLTNIMSKMDPKLKPGVKAIRSSHIFKFGGEENLPNLGTVKIPCSIGEQNVHIITEIVESDIPCFFVQGGNENTKAKIDTKNDMINIFGHDVRMISAGTSHYFMAIRGTSSSLESVLYA